MADVFFCLGSVHVLFFINLFDFSLINHNFSLAKRYIPYRMVFDSVVNSYTNLVTTKPYSGLESSTTCSTYLTVSLIPCII